MKTISLILLTCSFLSISAQEKNTYKDIFVGKYEGYVNESDYGDTASGYWSSILKILTITNSAYGDTFVDINGMPLGTNHFKTFEDSVLINISAQEYNNPDSIFYNCFGTTYTYKDGVGKLFSDSTFEFWYYVPPADGDYWGYFKGKKTESYAGINNINKKDITITIFPNPAKNNVQLVMSNVQLSKNTSVFIYDVFGKIVRVIASEAWQSVQADSREQSSRYDVLNIDVSQLPSGVYFVKIGSITKKFVKM